MQLMFALVFRRAFLITTIIFYVIVFSGCGGRISEKQPGDQDQGSHEYSRSDFMKIGSINTGRKDINLTKESESFKEWMKSSANREETVIMSLKINDKGEIKSIQLSACAPLTKEAIERISELPAVEHLYDVMFGTGGTLSDLRALVSMKAMKKIRITALPKEVKSLDVQEIARDNNIEIVSP